MLEYAMLNSQQKKELSIKEAKFKEKCRENLKSKRSFKWVWLHIMETTRKYL